MQEAPLLLSGLLEHGRTVYATSKVLTWEGDRAREASYAEVGERAHRLAGALAQLGVQIGDRVEMTFRRLFTADGIHDYFWKARPVRVG